MMLKSDIFLMSSNELIIPNSMNPEDLQKYGLNKFDIQIVTTGLISDEIIVSIKNAKKVGKGPQLILAAQIEEDSNIVFFKGVLTSSEFLKIIDSTKDKKFTVNADMMNLLGCSKENFYKLMTYMDYKKDKAVDTYIFKGDKRKKKKIIQFDKKENPFNKLLSLNIK